MDALERRDDDDDESVYALHPRDPDSRARRIRDREHETRLDDPYSDEHFIVVGLMYRVLKSRADWPVVAGSRVVVLSIDSENEVTVVAPSCDGTLDRDESFVVTRCNVDPYQFGSRWSELSDCRIRMFPLTMDAATSVYQIQGVTLREREYRRCYIDLRGMDSKSIYVTLSRFEKATQIVGAINIHG